MITPENTDARLYALLTKIPARVRRFMSQLVLWGFAIILVAGLIVAVKEHGKDIVGLAIFLLTILDTAIDAIFKALGPIVILLLVLICLLGYILERITELKDTVEKLRERLEELEDTTGRTRD